MKEKDETYAQTLIDPAAEAWALELEELLPGITEYEAEIARQRLNQASCFYCEHCEGRDWPWGQ